MADLSSFPITKKWPAKNPDIIQLYSLPTPNGVKVSIALEELGLAYEPHRIEFGDFRQQRPRSAAQLFRKIGNMLLRWELRRIDAAVA